MYEAISSAILNRIFGLVHSSGQLMLENTVPRSVTLSEAPLGALWSQNDLLLVARTMNSADFFTFESYVIDQIIMSMMTY
jgi:hypothetical protein